MKKLALTLATVLTLGFKSVFAQCSINTNNTVVGVTPTNSDDTLTQGVAYSQTFQVYVPATYSGFTVDSIHISSITGAPNGLSIVYNPASQTIKGGQNGAICFNGATTSAVGSYPLTFNGNIYTSVTTVPLSSLSSQFSYTFNVKAPVQQAVSCDTIFNMTQIDTPEIWTFGQGNSGYLAGNNSYGDQAKAEEFTGNSGNNVTGAYLFFSAVTINSSDSNMTIAINVYDTTGTGGGPGNVLATYNLPLRMVAADVAAVAQYQQLVPLYVPFYAAPSITSGSFFIGVVLPTTTGDTVALYSNSQTTVNGRGWEQWSDGTWNSWDSVYTAGTIYHSGLYIAAITCPPANPIAGFGITSSACAGGTVQFANETVNGSTSWSWSFAGGTPSSSTSENPAVIYNAAGTYSVKLVTSNSLGTDSITQTIIVSANPVASVATTPATSSTSATGAATITVSSGTSPYSYLWSNGGSASSITNVVSGDYSVTVVDANGCQYVDDTVHISYVNGIIELNSAQQVKIYPNPAYDVLNLVWSEKSNADVAIVDLNGKIISSFVTIGDTRNDLNIKNLASGAYILRITDKSDNQQHSLLFSKF